MRGIFDRRRPDADAARWVKAKIGEHFELADSTTLSVVELRCHDPGCPPVETMVTARDENGRIQDWRIAKPISEIDAIDIETLELQS